MKGIKHVLVASSEWEEKERAPFPSPCVVRVPDKSRRRLRRMTRPTLPFQNQQSKPTIPQQLLANTAKTMQYPKAQSKRCRCGNKTPSNQIATQIHGSSSFQQKLFLIFAVCMYLSTLKQPNQPVGGRSQQTGQTNRPALSFPRSHDSLKKRFPRHATPRYP